MKEYEVALDRDHYQDYRFLVNTIGKKRKMKKKNSIIGFNKTCKRTHR